MRLAEMSSWADCDKTPFIVLLSNSGNSLRACFRYEKMLMRESTLQLYWVVVGFGVVIRESQWAIARYAQ